MNVKKVWRRNALMNVKTQNVSAENANAKTDSLENAVSLRTAKRVIVPTWRNVIAVV